MISQRERSRRSETWSRRELVDPPRLLLLHWLPTDISRQRPYPHLLTSDNMNPDRLYYYDAQVDANVSFDSGKGACSTDTRV